MSASTVRELCTGDVRAVETNESGRLVGVVSFVRIGATQSYVGLAGRTVIVGNDVPAFEHVSAEVAHAVRSGCDHDWDEYDTNLNGADAECVHCGTLMGDVIPE